jgi:hypothetical protein
MAKTMNRSRQSNGNRGGERKTRVEEVVWQLDSGKLARLGIFDRPGVGGVLTWTSPSGQQARIAYRFETYIGPSYDWRNGQSTLTLQFPSLQLTVINLRVSCPNFGGRRWWFECPGCQCRVRILYAESLGNLFVCRHCLSLAYESQLLHKRDRALRTVGMIRRALGGRNLNPYYRFPLRPTNVRWEKYRRLRHREWKASRKCLAIDRARMERRRLPQV